MDGAETLSEAAKMLRDFADHIEKLEREGWQLDGPVADDYGEIRKLPKKARHTTAGDKNDVIPAKRRAAE